ncbi:unnamed protein product [Thelazia callipaeda]|uniref:Uncharacterized protein n=1 Tax=Thelazia callipaeda TaxID=103827 RepID=A0A0N5D048_THECL|nr:unnamed protein product [Thelazia callipaeda]
MVIISVINISRWRLIIISIILVFVITISKAEESVAQRCRRLFACAITKECIKLPFIADRFNGPLITAQHYNDLDTGIDYGCIFTAGCLDECNKCPLCEMSKQQLIDVLNGVKRTPQGECSVLVNCAADCLKRSNSNFTVINYCFRHECAYHCFDGTCPICSTFITRLFNQACVSGNLRRKMNFQGQCYEMFRAMVYAKFKQQFRQAKRAPAIGIKHNFVWPN